MHSNICVTQFSPERSIKTYPLIFPEIMVRAQDIMMVRDDTLDQALL